MLTSTSKTNTYMLTHTYLQTSRIYGLRIGFLSIKSLISDWTESDKDIKAGEVIAKIRDVCDKTLRADDLYHASLTSPKTEK